jgi:spectinomycin phosphotransferase
VRSPPEDLETDALIASLAEGGGFDVQTADYATVGGGSHHWVVADVTGAPGFVTVDDLDQKSWLGDTRDRVFEGHRRCLGTAVALRDSGLGFVLAPILTPRGEAVRRAGPRYAVALYPFVDGQSGAFGRYEEAERSAVLAMLTQLHAATPVVASMADTVDLEIPGRRSLESALHDVDQTWWGGPLSENARQVLAPRAAHVADLLALAGRLSAEVGQSKDRWVVTHGEPHAANVMKTPAGHVLIDWDTVALGPPERDLWMLVGGGDFEPGFEPAATGYDLDEAALRYFRLRWALADIAAFTEVLRSPHQHSPDTAWALDNLTYYLSTRFQWSAMLG